MSRFSSSIDVLGDNREPEVIFYTATIVNNETDDVVNDNDFPVRDPPIRFNETREKPIIEDTSLYQYSIIRFSMNGANENLPLFIPQIQSDTGQTDPNLTVYGLGLSYSDNTGINVVSDSGYEDPYYSSDYGGLTYVEYQPEVRNQTIAPIPTSTNNKNYVGIWDITKTYFKGNIVRDPVVSTQYYECSVAGTVGAPTPDTNTGFQFYGAGGGSPQDIASKYYWVLTYSHFVALVQTALERANLKLFQAYQTAGGAYYANYAAWVVDMPTPIMSYDPNTGLFSINYPPVYLPLAQQTAQGYSAPKAQVLQLYFNTNMWGLFSNFDNTFFNNTNPTFNAVVGGVRVVVDRWAYPGTQIFGSGFSYLLNVAVLDSGANINSPTALVATPSPVKWVKMTQDYRSTGSLWSPVDSIVFTTNLMPVFNEQQAPPNVLGGYNIGNSAPVSQSAFQPVMADVSVDLSTNPEGYRNFIYYSPTAEFRMADFQKGHGQELRTIDIQIFWKDRLSNQLIPISMFNLSSVNIKLMFRKKMISAKGQRQAMN